MTTAEVVEMPVTVNNSPLQDYDHLDDHTQPTYGTTSRFKPFAVLSFYNILYIYIYKTV